MRFVGSFTRENRPDVVMLTGGEPLLLPALVEELSARARSVGSRTALLSGMFFARSREIPPPVLRAIRGVDHFSASLDAHHEREIPRADVFRAVHRIRETGVAVSFHLTGEGADDPYLADITRAVDSEFGGQVPSLVNEVRAFGRAASWAAPARTGPDRRHGVPVRHGRLAGGRLRRRGARLLQPGHRGPAVGPAHLYLGHVDTDDWATVRGRALESPVLRMIRTVGPAHLAARAGVSPAAPRTATAAGPWGRTTGSPTRPVRWRRGPSGRCWT